MANSSPANDANHAMIKRAWNVLLPSCVQEEVRDDSFGLGPTQSCTPDKFYDILRLWWNQELQLANPDQLQPNHLNILRNYLHPNTDTHQIESTDWTCAHCSTNNDATHVICSVCFTESGKPQPMQIDQEEEKQPHKSDGLSIDSIAKYLGFHQPKNGTCGLVAGLHAILLYKMWDQVISHSMEQMSKPVQPQFDYKHLMASTIAHALMTCANAASRPIQYDPKSTTQTQTVPKSWTCSHCKTSNNAENVFCKTCYKEPPKEEPEATATDTTDENTEKVTIDACSKIIIVTDGGLPAPSDDHAAVFYNEQLFGFNMHCIEYDSNDTEGTTLKLMDYLLTSIDFEGNFISKGCCIRILLSLILTHGIERCEYELLLAEYEEIFRQFRDESLVLGPYGFCSQNLVNLTMFGHCKPVIESPSYLTYPYGFLGHDVINPGATGFSQIGYGYEYPLYPIWVVLSGTHYTTLFGIPTHVQRYNGEHVLDCYHAMVKWINDQNKPNPKDNAKDKEKTDVKMKDNTQTNNNNNSNQNNVNTSAPQQDWKCDICARKNDKTYTICAGCFTDKPNTQQKQQTSSNNQQTNGWKCLNCGKDNDKTHVICGGCFSDKAKATTDTNVAAAEEVKTSEEDNKDAVHFEVDLLSYNGLPPSGPLLAPISIHIITEKENTKEKQERDRVIQSNEVLSMIDHDETDETKKLKYIKGHALVQRIESKQRKNVYYYEIAISLESHFEEIQNWKSPYFMTFKDEEEWKKVKEYFDPKILPNFLKNKSYEYPSIKWRCCSCYLGDDMTKKYAGYNNLENGLCKACRKPMYEGLRTLIVSYEHVPFYIRESKIDKVYQNAMVKLLIKRFRNLVVGVVDNDCLPVI